MRRTKIVCTLGPASRGPHQIGRLIDAGMDVARLNLSHGSHEDHAVAFERVREEARRKKRHVAILLDLAGPKIRTGLFPAGEVHLATNSIVRLVGEEIPGDEKTVPIAHPSLQEACGVGNEVLLNDGLVRLEVIESGGSTIRARVIDGGSVSDHKGVHFPGGVRAPALTEKDLEDIRWGRELGADFFGISFVEDAEDIARARTLSADVPLIAKIERRRALDQIEAIADAADGLMVARGDLGVELGPEKVPLVQKRAIEVANARGKVVIVATEMLESMKSQPRPTRAEASDVANAVLDGADALMLSGETATGRYAAEAVSVMVRIVGEVESSARYRWPREVVELQLGVSASAVARAAVVAAKEMNIEVIAVFTVSGGSARLLSDYRPLARIVALSPREDVCRRLALYWGVHPLICDVRRDTDAMVVEAERRLLESGQAKPGEDIILTMGVPVGSGAQTNLLKIHRMGD